VNKPMLERKDAILLNMTAAMKAIAPPAQGDEPPAARESPVTPAEEPGNSETHVSWWRRIFR
jgi:hypothetical protein